MKLNKSLIFAAVAGVSVMTLTSSCNDFLDRNRYPLDQQTDQPAYWNNPVNVEAQLNELYDDYTGYGNGTSWVNDFYYRSLSDDQCSEIASGSGVIFCQWPYQYAPESNSVWNASYVEVRKCNTVIVNVGNSSLSELQKANFIGIARLNRAFQYYDLVRHLGDVPLIEEILNVGSEQLYGPRTPRNQVMDFVLEDLNYAVKNIAQQENKIEWSKDMANAMKAEICLYEAAYAKYHQQDQARATKYYNEVVNACEALMGRYELCDNYADLYNSCWAADDEKGIKSLRDNKEVIFMKGYIQGTMGNSICKYTSSNTPICGMTKDAFNAFLFTDGKPLASTSCDKSDAAKVDGDKLSIADLLAVRDSRLSAMLDTYLGYSGNTFQRVGNSGAVISDPLSSTTGYTIKKFINTAMTYDQLTIDGSGALCAPIYWMSQIYLALAEAKAELGTLTDGDINNTLNKVYKRAGLPEQTLASLSAMNDPANNQGVSSLLWEIRRCRRCEFMFDRNTRYWDMIRWHQLDKLDTVKYPDIALGANVSNGTGNMNANVAVSNGYINAAQNAASTSTRVFTEREYLEPLGTIQLSLNPALTQNPGWGN